MDIALALEQGVAACGEGLQCCYLSYNILLVRLVREDCLVVTPGEQLG